MDKRKWVAWAVVTGNELYVDSTRPNDRFFIFESPPEDWPCKQSTDRVVKVTITEEA